MSVSGRVPRSELWLFLSLNRGLWCCASAVLHEEHLIHRKDVIPLMLLRLGVITATKRTHRVFVFEAIQAKDSCKTIKAA